MRLLTGADGVGACDVSMQRFFVFVCGSGRQGQWVTRASDQGAIFMQKILICLRLIINLRQEPNL